MADNIDNTEQHREKPQAPPLLGKLVRKVPLNLLRFWWAFGIIPCVGLGVAAMLSSKMASTSYSFDATILYSGIPVESAAEKLYIPPDLKTMTQFIKSPLVMQAVCEDMSLPVPPTALASMITVVEPKSMQRIGLTLSWADQEEGRKILDRVIEVYSRSISDTRQEVVSRYLVDLQRRLAANDVRMAAAQTRLREFLERENVRDAEAELIQLQTDIGSLETEREDHLRRIEGYKAQEKKVMDRLESQKEAQTVKAREEKEAAAAEESLADNRRRQDRINELIEEKRRQREIRSRLHAKQLEFNRKLKTVRNRVYISRAEFEEVYADVRGLQAQLEEGPEIKAWQQELETARQDDRADRQ